MCVHNFLYKLALLTVLISNMSVCQVMMSSLVDPWTGPTLANEN